MLTGQHHHIAAGALLLLPCISVTPAGAQDLWLMKGHDVRRTGQSLNDGPAFIDTTRSWTAELPAAMVINIGASVDERGVYLGSWGLLRRDPTTPDPRFWDKSDGQAYGLDLETGMSLWDEGRGELDLVPRCYDYEGRGPNPLWCGFTPYEVSFYNGTVEGQAAIDTARNVVYFGRGDGKLFALNRDTGEILWRYVTFNPQLPDDPDGGGEVVSSPLLVPDGTIYFGTWGEGPYETNAFYAVNPDGTLAWRYPADSSLTHRIFASPALSPDGETIYVSSFRNDGGDLPATLYAFNRTAVGDSDEGRLKWSLRLERDGSPFQTSTLAVGADGTIYVGGFFPIGFGLSAVVAIEDLGDRTAFRWNPMYRDLPDGSQYALGITLRENGGRTVRVYAATANLGTTLFNARVAGSLFALDPATGEILDKYDPSDDVESAVGSLNSPAIDASGVLYFGVRGRFGDDPIDGYYFAVGFDSATATFETRWHHRVDGYVEWNHPAIGPDGGIYVAASPNRMTDQIRTKTYPNGDVPEGSTPLLYGLKGPAEATGAVTEIPGDAQQNPIRSVIAYPNPFTASTTVVVDVAHPGEIEMEVLDLLGRRVARWVTAPDASGRIAFDWSESTGVGVVSSGAYVVRVRFGSASGQTSTRSRLIVKN